MSTALRNLSYAYEEAEHPRTRVAILGAIRVWVGQEEQREEVREKRKALMREARYPGVSETE